MAGNPGPLRVIPERQRARWMLQVGLVASGLWALGLTVLGRWSSVGSPVRDIVIIGAVSIVVGGGCGDRIRAAAGRHTPLPEDSYVHASPASARLAVALSALLLAAATIAAGVVMPALLAGVIAYDIVVRRAEDANQVQLWRAASWRASFGASPPELYTTGSTPAHRGDTSGRLRRVFGHQIG